MAEREKGTVEKSRAAAWSQDTVFPTSRGDAQCPPKRKLEHSSEDQGRGSVGRALSGVAGREDRKTQMEWRGQQGDSGEGVLQFSWLRRAGDAALTQVAECEEREGPAGVPGTALA